MEYIMVIHLIRYGSDQSISSTKEIKINKTIITVATDQSWMNKRTYKSKDRKLGTSRTVPDVIIISSIESNKLRQVRIEYPDESKVEVNEIVINLGGEIDRI